jgi:hypothetical protein
LPLLIFAIPVSWHACRFSRRAATQVSAATKSSSAFFDNGFRRIGMVSPNPFSPISKTQGRRTSHQRNLQGRRSRPQRRGERNSVRPGHVQISNDGTYIGLLLCVSGYRLAALYATRHEIPLSSSIAPSTLTNCRLVIHQQELALSRDKSRWRQSNPSGV